MRTVSYIALFLGVCLFAGLAVYHGIGDVVRLIAAMGWGLLAILAVRVLPILANALAWLLLLPPEGRPSFLASCRIQWISYAVGALLPATQVGGELVRARLAAQSGLSGAMAGASVTVDLTLAVLTQTLFSLLGIAILVGLGTDRAALEPILLAVAVFAGLFLLFYLGQRKGLFGAGAALLERIARGRDWTRLLAGASATDAAIRELYQRRPALAASGTARFFGWVLGTAEVWLAFLFLDHPVTLIEALMIESLVQAVRSAAFVVPGALGVQEGAFILIGSILGIPTEVSFAASLVKRVRDLVYGIPALLLWQYSEGVRFARKVR